jgi:hypothetical protein
MAKLYWRIKRDGKWTWAASTPENTKYVEYWPCVIYTGPNESAYITNLDDDPVDKPEVYTDEE